MNSTSNMEKAKIVVVGDSGVGKTSLVHLIVQQEVLKKPNWTIGCSVDVKLHEFKDGTHQHKTYFIEFFDIGGNIAHRSSAKMFFSGVDGIILVHDLTNRKSQENLKQWMADVIEQNEHIQVCLSDYDSKSHLPVTSSLKYTSNYSAQMPPLLVVGTKLDEAQMVRNTSSLRGISSIALEMRADEINLDCMQPKYLAPATSNSIKLAKFFDKVVEYKISQLNREENFILKKSINGSTDNLYLVNKCSNLTSYINNKQK